jgi:hypothetical protein
MPENSLHYFFLDKNYVLEVTGLEFKCKLIILPTVSFSPFSFSLVIPLAFAVDEVYAVRVTVTGWPILDFINILLQTSCL